MAESTYFCYVLPRSDLVVYFIYLSEYYPTTINTVICQTAQSYVQEQYLFNI